MGHVANAIGWLTVAIAAGIVSLQVAYLLSADSIANHLPNKRLIDMTSAVILPTARKGSVLEPVRELKEPRESLMDSGKGRRKLAKD
jgi:hypothetical protein